MLKVSPNNGSLIINGTGVFDDNLNATGEIVVNRGGTRSSKTYSLIQLFIYKLVTEPNKRMLITRKTFPALRNSVYRDLIEYIKENGVYYLGVHNKSEHTFTYKPTGSTIIFASIDDSQKFRGAEWNYAWFNEANEFTFDDFNQVFMRLSRKRKDQNPNQIFLDFNPSDIFNWIKTELEDKKRCDVIHSTFYDNTYLTPETIKRIEWLKDNDESFWLIYGLGQYARISGLIYNKWETVDTIPENPKWVTYGLDFGYTNDPTALIQVSYYEGALYCEELIYETGLTNQDINIKLRDLGISRRDIIYADSSEPKSIEEIHRAGFTIKPTIKGKGSVMNGIDILKRYNLFVNINSNNLLKEIKNYKWETDKKGDKLKNVPVDYNNHLMDALRYAVVMKIGFGRRKIRAYG